MTMLSQDLDCPPLESVKNVFQNGLRKSFSEVSVNVVDCPDLTKDPFNLACKGLGGKRAIIELGGVPYLVPEVRKDKLYDMAKIAKDISMDPCFILGAGAGPWPFLGRNSEMIANLCIDGSEINSRTHVANVKENQCKELKVSVIPNTETRCALLANLFYCEGTTSKVLEVSCKTRIGANNFITSMRELLAEHFNDKKIGVGGVFVMKSGKALQHCMPDFSSVPLNSEEDINKWLNFYIMSAPLIALGTFMSSDIPDYDLRLQHFHSFSNHGEAGHYHEDISPQEVEYLGYFNLGQKIYRIDKPVKTHSWGRD